MKDDTTKTGITPVWQQQYLSTLHTIYPQIPCRMPQCTHSLVCTLPRICSMVPVPAQPGSRACHTALACHTTPACRHTCMHATEYLASILLPRSAFHGRPGTAHIDCNMVSRAQSNLTMRSVEPCTLHEGSTCMFISQQQRI